MSFFCDALFRNFEEDPEHAVRRPSKEELTVLGTTVDIVAFREQEQIEGFHHGPVFIVKFLGRQRFRLLECLRKMNGYGVCVCVYVCSVYIHTCVFTCVYMCMCVFMYVRVCSYVRVCIGSKQNDFLAVQHDGG